MGHDACVAGLLGHLDCLQGLGQGADLVDLDQNGVGATELDALCQALGVGDEQVVANKLDLLADAVGQCLPAVPIFLGHAVLDGDDGVLVNQGLPVVDHLGAGKLAVLASQNVLAGFGVVELGGSGIHGKQDVLAGNVTCSLASLDDVVQGLLVGGEVGSEAALVADAAAQAGIVKDFLQGVVDLGAPAQCLGEGGSADGHDHELLEVNVVVGMGAAVQDIHHGGGQLVGVHATDVLVQGKLGGFRCSASGCQGGAQNGVGAELALVVGAVGLDHLVVDSALIVGLKANQHVGDFLVNVGNGLQRALAQITLGIAIAKLDGLECARRSAGRNHSAANGTIVQRDLDLDRGITARIQNLATVHIDDDAHGMQPPGCRYKTCTMVPLAPCARPRFLKATICRQRSWGLLAPCARIRFPKTPWPP